MAKQGTGIDALSEVVNEQRRERALYRLVGKEVDKAVGEAFQKAIPVIVAEVVKALKGESGDTPKKIA